MKKIISLLIAMCMVMGCFVTSSVMAEDAESVVELSLGSASAKSGDSISIPLNVKNNVNGVSNFDITVTYSSKYLTYSGYETKLYGGTLVANGNNKGKVILSSMDYKNSMGDGAVFMLNFTVNDTNDKNVVTELELQVDRFCYLDSTYTVINTVNTATGGSVVINADETTTTTTETTTVTTTVTTTETTTETTTVTTTETTTEPTTVTTTEATTVTTTESTTEPTTVTTTETTTEAATVTSTESTTEAATVTTAESTTVTATETTTTVTESGTETTTRRVVSSGGGGHSSGAGASILEVYNYDGSGATTTTEITTESTTGEEYEVSAEETVISNDVKVSIGKNTVVIGEDEYTMDAVPYIQASSNSTMVPLRFVAIAIGGGNVENADNSGIVKWDAVTKTATINADGNVIKFKDGSEIMTVNGRSVTMDNGVKAEIKDGRMYIPFRALGNALGVDVDWDAGTRTAIYKSL